MLLEAMASLTAVVASDIPGYRNVATSGVDAILVPPGDVSALASSLLTVLCDESVRESLIANGVRTAASMSMDRLANMYVDRYRKVLNSPS